VLTFQKKIFEMIEKVLYYWKYAFVCEFLWWTIHKCKER